MIVSSGTLLKWETALRKLLEFLGKSSAGHQLKRPTMVLVLMRGAQVITTSDKTLLENSLKAIDVKVSVQG